MLTFAILVAFTTGAEQLSERLLQASTVVETEADVAHERRRLYGRKYTTCQCERPNEGSSNFNKMRCVNGEQFYCGETATCYRKDSWKMIDFLGDQQRPAFDREPIGKLDECLEKDTDYPGYDIDGIFLPLNDWPEYYPPRKCQLLCQDLNAGVFVGKSGENTCGLGENKGLTEAECKKIPGDLKEIKGNKLNAAINVINQSTDPKGCFNHDGQIYFNKHAAGGKHAGRMPICKRPDCKFWSLLPKGNGAHCLLKSNNKDPKKYVKADPHKKIAEKNRNLRGIISGPKHCGLCMEKKVGDKDHKFCSTGMVQEGHNCMLRGIDFAGGDVGSGFKSSLAHCQKECTKKAGCNGWTFREKDDTCNLKKYIKPLAISGFAEVEGEFDMRGNTGVISGHRDCVPQEHGPVCRAYKESDEIDGKKAGKAEKDPQVRREKIQRAEALDLRCPNRAKILTTPFKGESGQDRWNEWDCPDCNCGCNVRRGCAVNMPLGDGPNAVPCCTQPDGGLRFPNKKYREAAAPAHLANFHQDFEYEAQGGMAQFISGIKSNYKRYRCEPKGEGNAALKKEGCDAARPDRTYQFHTTAFPSYLSPSVMYADKSDAWVNIADGPIDAWCPKGKAIIGIESKWSHMHMDRRFKMKCAKMTGAKILTSTMRETKQINNLGDNFDSESEANKKKGKDYSCMHDEVMCGLSSDHIASNGVVHDEDCLLADGKTWGKCKTNVEDRWWRLKCCRIMVARDQCYSITVDIRSVLVSKKSEPKNTVIDKIQANACGHTSSVKGTITKQRVKEETVSATYELSESFDRTFSADVSVEAGLTFTHGISVGPSSTEFGGNLKATTTSGFSMTRQRGRSVIKHKETKLITSFDQGFEYEAAANTQLVVTAFGQEYEGDVFWTGLATCRDRKNVVLETKMVDGIYHGVGVGDVTLTFQTEVCPSDGYTMRRNRFCVGSDKMRRKVGGEEKFYEYKTSQEARTACDLLGDCAGFMDEHCNNQGPFYLCKKDAVLRQSPNSCTFDRDTNMDAVLKAKPEDTTMCKCMSPATAGADGLKILCRKNVAAVDWKASMSCPPKNADGKKMYCASHYAVEYHSELDLADQNKYVTKNLCAEIPEVAKPILF